MGLREQSNIVGCFSEFFFFRFTWRKQFINILVFPTLIIIMLVLIIIMILLLVLIIIIIIVIIIISASYCTQVQRYLPLTARKSNVICLSLQASPTLSASHCTQVQRYLNQGIGV